MKDKVWEFRYNSCIYESAMATISLHKTQKGAELAMEFHKEEKRKEYDFMYGKRKHKIMEFGEMEAWGVAEREILE